MVMKLFVPSLEMTGHPPTCACVQLVVVKSGFCCKVQTVKVLFQYGQETLRAAPDSVVSNCGMPGIVTLVRGHGPESPS